MTAEHGTLTRYKGGSNGRGQPCRCDPCRVANRDWQRERAKTLPDRAPLSTVNAWRTLHEAGLASAACDQIVAKRDPPARLLKKLGLT